MLLVKEVRKKDILPNKPISWIGVVCDVWVRVPILIYSAQSDLNSMDIYALCCLLRVYIWPNKESLVRFLEHLKNVYGVFVYDSNYLPKACLFEMSCFWGKGQGINTAPSRKGSVYGHSMLSSIGDPNSTSITYCSQSHSINTTKLAEKTLDPDYAAVAIICLRDLVNNLQKQVRVKL